MNEAFVKRFVGAQNPLGQRSRGVGLGPVLNATIVGVVNDAVYRTVRTGVVPTMYLPMAQADRFGSGFSITARLAGSRSQSKPQIAEALERVCARLVVLVPRLRGSGPRHLVQERLVAMLSGFFGAAGAAAGGARSVRRHLVRGEPPPAEIAVRMALGATGAGVVRLVLRRVAMLMAIGGVLGLGLSLWAAKFVEPLLFRVGRRDPTTLARLRSSWRPWDCSPAGCRPAPYHATGPERDAARVTSVGWSVVRGPAGQSRSDAVE